MNGATITMAPTLCVPEKLSREELIEQINHLQDEAWCQALKLNETCAKLGVTGHYAKQIESVLGALVDSYDAGDQAAILLQLKKMSENRKEQKARVH